MIVGYNPEDKVLLAVDCIIFGFDNEDLKVLLVKRDFEPEKGKWSLIGGFLKKDETLNQAGNRVLKHLTGYDDIYMEQFNTYSEVDRDPVERTISVSYYALINIETHSKLEEKYAARWFALDEIPKLIFDHDIMVRHALNRLRYRATHKPIGFELLPEKFTMKQLQKLYESILNTKLDKRNFASKINTLDILVKLKEKDMNSSRKGSFLYTFDINKYKKKVNEGFTFKI